MLTCPSCGRANPAEASFCMGCATSLSGTAAAHETRKTVTALFCDLVGSTTLGEQHDPEVLRPLLHAYFEEMRGAVERYGGRVEKFIGDAVSAVFGVPAAHEDDALRAVRAAAEMRDRLTALSAGSPIQLSCRIGVTTGEVLVPAGGEPLIGDAMNIAARLQESATPGEVLIGEPTYRLIQDAVEAAPVAPIVLKGKAEPVAAYRLVRVASVLSMRARRLDAPMVGRKREAALLEAAFERAASDRACQLFTVLGIAGAGKSRLVEEFLAGHGAGAGGGAAEILRGRCLPYGEGITWYPVGEALRGALGLADFADAAQVQVAIHAAVGAEEHARSLEANLGRLLAAGEGGSPEETFWAIRLFLEARGRERPLVVVFDDIHWGQETFLDFVEHVADWSRDAPILLLCMARPDLLDARPAWGGGKTNATTISLAPLSDAECAELIASLLGSSTLPDPVSPMITAVAGGNPLFVEEMLRMLIDDGRLAHDGERWVAAGDLADVRVPPTISALLSARLDRLSEDERGVVEAAAVEGKEFHRGAVAALLPDSAEEGLGARLRSLTRKELISPERSSLPGEEAYRFRHLLVRDAAHDAIPKSERARLHRAFADWLERVAGNRVIEREEIVGYHLEMAHRYRTELGLPEDHELRLRAAKALGSAGARALDAGEVRAAVDLLRPAAELAQGDSMELDTLAQLGDALHDAGDLDGSLIVYERLADVARAVDDPVSAMQARVALFEGRLHATPDEVAPDEERRLGEEAIRTYRARGAERLVPRALKLLAVAEHSQGCMQRMLERTTEVLGLAQSAHDRRLVETCMFTIGSALEFGPTPLSEGLERANGYADAFAAERAIRATILGERAWINAFLGRGDAARSDLAMSRAICAELGRTWGLSLLGLIEAYVAWFEDGPLAALLPFREGLRELAERGDKVNAVLLEASLARVLLELRRDRDAERLLAGFGQSRVQASARIQARSIAAVIAARRGDRASASRLSSEAEGMTASTDLAIDHADVALDKAEILFLADRPAEACASAEDALARYERKEYAIGIKRARAFLAALSG